MWDIIAILIASLLLLLGIHYYIIYCIKDFLNHNYRLLGVGKEWDEQNLFLTLQIKKVKRWIKKVNTYSRKSK